MHKGYVKTDLIGKQFGPYIVSDEYYQKQYGEHCSKTYWRCKCVNCGNEKYIIRESLLTYKSNYCNECRPTGIRNEKLYHVYHGILQRCYNENNPSYKKYGAKGIYMCDEWKSSYDVFKKWAHENGYCEGLTIDRIDSNDGYRPENCRWITLSENSARANVGRHKSKTKLTDVYAINSDGEIFDIDNISKFCIEHGLNKSSVMASLHGRCSNEYSGWLFHSNKTKISEGVTTIESIS